MNSFCVQYIQPMTKDQSLDPATLKCKLGDWACRFDIELLPACDSTNTLLLDRAAAGAPGGTVIVARSQTAGRGRQGRVWLSSPGDSLTFSLLWRFPAGTPPAGLSLAVGLAVSIALEKVGAGGTGSMQLKWPNDLLKAGRKLGGILIELVPGVPHAAVIGIGLNLRMPPGLPEEIRAVSAALGEEHDAGAVLAAILVELLAVLEHFAIGGFTALREGWIARHAFENVPVRLLSDFAPPCEGICRGVDADGALLLEVGGRTERILSGEVSLRAS